MLYEIVAEVNGREVKRGVRADTREEAIEKFRAEWPEASEPVVTESWSET